MRILERIYATGIWTASSAIHLGGGEDTESGVDMALLRSDDGESFLVPAASIAGAARSHVTRRALSYNKFRQGDEPPAIQALFGGKYTSLITVHDAPCLGVGGATSVRRDGVAIDSKSGTALDEAKFDLEVLPAGTQFGITIQLVAYDSPILDVTVGELKKYFRAIIEALSTGEIRLGARTRRGLGRGGMAPADLEIRRLDMNDSEHVEGWLYQEWRKAAAERKGEVLSLEALSPEQIPDSRRRLSIRADFKLRTSVLIRASGDTPGAPDMVHLTENGAALISGSSLAGALRHRAERIANTMLDAKEAHGLIEGMFGPLHKHGDNRTLTAGRVWVEEHPLAPDGGGLCVQGRVAIDRFTGGAQESALFDQAAWWPKSQPQHDWTFEVGLDLRDKGEDDSREAALLLHAFKDLWLGDLALGGETGVGRGVFRGVEARLSHPEMGELVLKKPSEDGQTVTLEGDLDGWEKLGTALAPSATPKEALNVTS